MATTNQNEIKWMVYDHDSQRSKCVTTILFARCGIKAIPYEEAKNTPVSFATLLVHCEELNESFIKLALLKRTANFDFRFYCTKPEDRNSQIAYLPDDSERLIS